MCVWYNIEECGLPTEGRLCKTKIDDRDGKRNECNLIRRGNLWYVPDGSMYVYYRPTHWLYADDQAVKAERDRQIAALREQAQKLGCQIVEPSHA